MMDESIIRNPFNIQVARALVTTSRACRDPLLPPPAWLPKHSCDITVWPAGRPKDEKLKRASTLDRSCLDTINPLLVVVVGGIAC